jgi:hypothetical protein
MLGLGGHRDAISLLPQVQAIGAPFVARHFSFVTHFINIRIYIKELLSVPFAKRYLVGLAT